MRRSYLILTAGAFVLGGMTRSQAVDVLAERGSITGTSEFKKQADGSWKTSPGSAYASASQFRADTSVPEVESRTRKEVVTLVMLDRTWGWMGWDVFLLYLDRDDVLVARDMVHLD